MNNVSKIVKKAGRPVKNIIKPIKDTPTRVAKSIMQNPPKKTWDYLKAKK